MLTLGIVCVALIISSPLRAQDGSPIKSDERVVLFDTAGWLDEAANTWHVPIAGWIFEPEEDSATRELLLRQFAAVLERTFLRDFEAADGAARMYAWLAEQGAAFHYVSSSPVQLSEAITGFLDAHGFPRGSMHLKEFRWKDRSFFNLFTSSMETKPPVIEEILARWPRRWFLLIGDSGEQDPEIYGEIARAHPEQVRGILIRDVTGEGRDSPRYGKAFAELPVERWMLLAAEDFALIGDFTATESSASGIQGFLKGILPGSQEGSGH